jgi:hypothetical protein
VNGYCSKVTPSTNKGTHTHTIDEIIGLQEILNNINHTGAINGLSIVDNKIELGGPLIKNTTISGPYTLNINNNRLTFDIESGGTNNYSDFTSNESLLFTQADDTSFAEFFVESNNGGGARARTSVQDGLRPQFAEIYASAYGSEEIQTLLRVYDSTLDTRIYVDKFGIKLGRILTSTSTFKGVHIDSTNAQVTIDDLAGNDGYLVKVDATGKLQIVNPSGYTYTASNGLTAIDNEIKLGGALTEDTTLEGDGYMLTANVLGVNFFAAGNTEENEFATFGAFGGEFGAFGGSTNGIGSQLFLSGYAGKLSFSDDTDTVTMYSEVTTRRGNIHLWVSGVNDPIPSFRIWNDETYYGFYFNELEVGDKKDYVLMLDSDNKLWKVAASSFADSINTHSWTDITDKPVFSTVATSGSYNDLTDKPVVPTTSGSSYTFTSTGTLLVPGLGLKSTAPLFDLWNTASASSDQKRWGLSATSTGGVFQLRAYNDDGTTGNSGIAIQIFRNGGSATDIHLLNVGGTTQFKVDTTNGVTITKLVGTGTRMVVVNANGVLSSQGISRSFTPTSTSDIAGNLGDITYDANYIYLKQETGWHRAALQPF